MSSLAPVLSCQNVTKRFSPTAKPAVQGVTLELQEGDLLGLLGPSGCGKTTLLRLVAGFERPETGEICLAGRGMCDQQGWVPPEKRQVGVVFQDYALFPHLSVMENVAFGLKQLKRRGQLKKNQIEGLAKEAIALVGLSGMEDRYPHALSGGQQQRVALARALAPRPPVVLLDEPFSNLDVQVRLRLRQEVRDILKNVGASGIFVTHDQEEALAIADKVAVMHEGHLMQLDTPERLYQNPGSRFVAEFVTQANFLPVAKLENGWVTELGKLERIPCKSACEMVRESLYERTCEEKGAEGKHLCGDGDLMIRQNDLKIVPDDNGLLLVKGRQFLGRAYQYSLLMPSQQELWVETAVHERFEVGDRVSVVVDWDRMRFFPKDGGPVEKIRIEDVAAV